MSFCKEDLKESQKSGILLAHCSQNIFSSLKYMAALLGFKTPCPILLLRMRN